MQWPNLLVLGFMDALSTNGVVGIGVGVFFHNFKTMNASLYIRKGLLVLALSWSVVAMLCENQLKAQCYGASQSVNELGIRIGSLTNASSEGGLYIPEKSAHLGYFNGIHYKRYGAIGAFRTSLGLTRYDHEDRRGCPNCLRVDGKVTNLKFRAGYEFFMMLGPIEPFFAIDLVAAYGTYKGETYSTGPGTYSESTDVRNRRGMGFGPAAGLRVWLGYSISISAEASLEAMFYGNSTQISQITPEAQTTSYFGNRFVSEFHPLNWVSLNVMF